MDVGPSPHMQMSKPGEKEGLQTLLDSITAQTRPDVQHAAYHAKYLEQLMHQMESQPARCLVLHVLPEGCITILTTGHSEYSSSSHAVCFYQWQPLLYPVSPTPTHPQSHVQPYCLSPHLFCMQAWNQ